MKNCLVTIALLFLLVIGGCIEENGNSDIPAEQPLIDRESKIPTDAVKITPATDFYPPVMHSDEYENPVPLPYPVNTPGGEDSAFIMPDGNIIYLFFTPDVNIPVEEQLLDGVTGIYVSHRVDGVWQGPQRIILQDPNKLALDGCIFVRGNEMLFCSAREGYTGVNWFTAEFEDGEWCNWRFADFEPEYEVGELHITDDGSELYFHSSRPGSRGGYDIWVSENAGGEWQEPEAVAVVNSDESDGWPFITEDGGELWFTRTYSGAPAIYRSKRIGGEWQEPELIVSQFAGEPSLDNEGNLYFTHHFFENGEMIEADIYVARRK